MNSERKQINQALKLAAENIGLFPEKEEWDEETLLHSLKEKKESKQFLDLLSMAIGTMPKQAAEIIAAICAKAPKEFCSLVLSEAMFYINKKAVILTIALKNIDKKDEKTMRTLFSDFGFIVTETGIREVLNVKSKRKLKEPIEETLDIQKLQEQIVKILDDDEMRTLCPQAMAFLVENRDFNSFLEALDEKGGAIEDYARKIKAASEKQ